MKLYQGYPDYRRVIPELTREQANFSKIYQKADQLIRSDYIKTPYIIIDKRNLGYI